jgi:hypothetical protein
MILQYCTSALGPSKRRYQKVATPSDADVLRAGAAISYSPTHPNDILRQSISLLPPPAPVLTWTLALQRTMTFSASAGLSDPGRINAVESHLSEPDVLATTQRS